MAGFNQAKIMLINIYYTNKTI